MIIAYSGCLLPLLIILNLFFGRLFLKTADWLAFEGILILLFLFNSYIKLYRFTHSSRRKGGDNVIDVEGKVINDKK